MTRQTSAPLDSLCSSTSDRSAHEFANLVGSLDLDIRPPYQRGRVWSKDQRIALIRSWLTATPTGVVILNDRATLEWVEANGRDPSATGEPVYACIDGQQRISAAIDWFGGVFAVPASWFAAEHVLVSEDTDDGPYVKWSGLSESRRRIFKNRARFAVSTARAATVQEEAAIYLLVNGGGVPQAEADMSHARGIATS